MKLIQGGGGVRWLQARKGDDGAMRIKLKRRRRPGAVLLPHAGGPSKQLIQKHVGRGPAQCFR